MGTISFTPITDGSTGTASQINTPLNTIVEAINGNIDTVNLTDGAVTTAKLANDSVTDAKRPRLLWGSYTRASNQSVSNATVTTVEFDSEVADDNNWHDNSTNPSRVTVSQAGLYRIEAYSNVNIGTDTTQDTQLGINVNGARVRTDIRELNASFDDVNQVSVTQLLSAGDYVEVQYYQNSGGAKNLGVGSIFLTVVKLSD